MAAADPIFDLVLKGISDAPSMADFKGTIRPDSSLREELGFDSMMAVELAISLEAACDIRIEDDELGGLVTVADCVALVRRKLAEKESARVA